MSKITNIRLAGDAHQVVTVSGGRKDSYRRAPCLTCPWRKDAVGEFPAEAFRISAHTAYDMAMEIFACHSSGAKKPATCAGFLLRGAAHNLSVRLQYGAQKIGNDLWDGGIELFDDYREMAEANGVDADDPVLRRCR